MDTCKAILISLSTACLVSCGDQSSPAGPGSSSGTPLSTGEAPNALVVSNVFPELHKLCKQGRDEQAAYLERASNLADSLQNNTLYWAGLSYCAYENRNHIQYNDALQMMVASAINAPPSNTLSELVYSFIDNGRISSSRMCVLAQTSKRLAGTDPKPFERYGEVKTTTTYLCDSLDMEGLKRIQK